MTSPSVIRRVLLGSVGAKVALGLASAAAVGGLASAAHAQTSSAEVDIQDVGVLERARPEYQARGVRLGAFTAYPQLTITPEYDDNIFASQDDPTGDFVTAVSPSVRVQSNWSRHELDGYARVVTDLFAANSDENTTDYAFGGGGRLDVGVDSAVTANLNYAHSTEPRTAENTIMDARDPIQYDTVNGSLGVSHTFNRLQISGTAGFSRYDYQDSVTFSGAPLPQGYRNETGFTLGGQASYSLSPALTVFGALRYNRRDYDEHPPEVLFDRNSDGVEGTVGVNLELTRLMRGSFEVGYFTQTYAQPGYPHVDGPAVHGQIEYFLTPLTTLTFAADRSVVDAADPVSISFIQNLASFRVDHELLRNVILSGRVGYEFDDYSGIDRQDSRPSLSVSGTYLLNRNVGLTGTYSYLDQSSSGAYHVNNFAVNIVSLSIVLQI